MLYEVMLFKVVLYKFKLDISRCEFIIYFLQQALNPATKLQRLFLESHTPMMRQYLTIKAQH
ncbi:MAG: hypothetical protein VX076_11965, partial [Pseudomonadota bacterium]|nr:hypothetical protein [Pseudomonadota bacterium]